MRNLAKRHSYLAVFTLLAGTAILFGGCGGGATSDPVQVEPEGHSLKPLVEGMAESGEVGSAGAELEQAVEEHPELKADIEELIKADGNPAQVKEKANAILQKL